MNENKLIGTFLEQLHARDLAFLKAYLNRKLLKISYNAAGEKQIALVVHGNNSVWLYAFLKTLSVLPIGRALRTPGQLDDEIDDMNIKICLYNAEDITELVEAVGLNITEVLGESDIYFEMMNENPPEN
jgi:hypothetical protein